jgi:methylglutaconyl-CoA hydratase
MSDPSYHLEKKPNGVATLTLNRPAIHNAFDDRQIAELNAALAGLAMDEGVRVVVLAGAGKNFSAGADLNWMRRTGSYGEAENLRDANALAELMQRLNELPKPTVARVQGAALGGGTGLVACCDIVIAAESASFGTTEVRLGIMPAVIGPYVIAAIGSRHARRLMVTGERISAQAAARIGLVHEVVADDQLEAAVDSVVSDLLKGGPAAITAAKRLVHDLAGRPISQEMIDDTAHRIAALRATPEAREGLGAFLEKRKPGWTR